MPYVDVHVTDEWYCAPDEEVVFTRPWYGTYMACDCLNVCAYDEEGVDETWCYSLIQYKACGRY